MRMVAWAAAIVLLFQPESVLGASFQMSFSAVVALIAVYEFVSTRRLNQEFKSRTLIKNIWVVCRRGCFNDIGRWSCDGTICHISF